MYRMFGGWIYRYQETNQIIHKNIKHCKSLIPKKKKNNALNIFFALHKFFEFKALQFCI